MTRPKLHQLILLNGELEYDRVNAMFEVDVQDLSYRAGDFVFLHYRLKDDPEFNVHSGMFRINNTNRFTGDGIQPGHVRITLDSWYNV